MTHTAKKPLQPLNQLEEALVRTLTRIMYALPRAIDADMLRERHLPLTEYIVLMYLSERPGNQMRMSELASECDTSVSGMTRIVTRLESQDLVRRVKCEEDARGWNAVLTDTGAERLYEVWPSHLAAVRRHFLEPLEGIDLRQLTTAFRKVASNH